MNHLGIILSILFLSLLCVIFTFKFKEIGYVIWAALSVRIALIFTGLFFFTLPDSQGDMLLFYGRLF